MLAKQNWSKWANITKIIYRTWLGSKFNKNKVDLINFKACNFRCFFVFCFFLKVRGKWDILKKYYGIWNLWVMKVKNEFVRRKIVGFFSPLVEMLATWVRIQVFSLQNLSKVQFFPKFHCKGGQSSKLPLRHFVERFRKHSSVFKHVSRDSPFLTTIWLFFSANSGIYIRYKQNIINKSYCFFFPVN